MKVTMSPRRKLVAIILAATLSVLGLVYRTPSASAAIWWRPGQITAWAYMIGYNQPIIVPSFISSPAGRHPNTAVDVDLGDDTGLASNGMPNVDANVVQSVRNIRAARAHAICYVDVGTVENWRSDYRLFDPSEIGSAMPGWSGENFVNVNDWSRPVPAPYETIQQIMTKRFKLCQEEGFAGIEADNVDAYTDGNLGGFTISQIQQETLVNKLVSLAHSDGLAYFLKNEINGDSFISNEAPKVDGEIVEQCWQYRECSALGIFVHEGKPILNVEYDAPSKSTLCREANAFPMASDSENLDVTEINYSCSRFGNGEAWQSGTTTPRPARSTPAATRRPTTTHK
jgi:endo-alpha-1,4-polygalactosaminidase (GH114 family)